MHTHPISGGTCEEVEVEDENRDEEIVDFVVELSYKIYANKSIRRRKDFLLFSTLYRNIDYEYIIPQISRLT
jgi:hypothetical protein